MCLKFKGFLFSRATTTNLAQLVQLVVGLNFSVAQLGHGSASTIPIERLHQHDIGAHRLVGIAHRNRRQRLVGLHVRTGRVVAVQLINAHAVVDAAGRMGARVFGVMIQMMITVVAVFGKHITLLVIAHIQIVVEHVRVGHVLLILDRCLTAVLVGEFFVFNKWRRVVYVVAVELLSIAAAYRVHRLVQTEEMIVVIGGQRDPLL